MSGTRYIENGLMQIAHDEQLTDEQMAGIFNFKLHAGITNNKREALINQKDGDGNSLIAVLKKRGFKETIEVLRKIGKESQIIAAKSSNLGLFKSRRPLSPIKIENLSPMNGVKTPLEFETTPGQDSSKVSESVTSQEPSSSSPRPGYR